MKRKQLGCMILILMLLVMSGCSVLQKQATTDVPKGYQLVEAGAEGFSICCREEYDAVYENGAGIYVYVGDGRDIPYVLVGKSADVTVDANQYLEENVYGYIMGKYGDSMVDQPSFELLGTKHRSYPGMRYAFELNGETVSGQVICITSGRDLICITAEFTDADKKTAVGAFEDAIETLRNGSAESPNTDTEDTGDHKDTTEHQEPDDKKTGSHFEVIPTAASQVELVEYNDGWVSMMVPKGWVAETTNGAEIELYSVRVYDPTCPSRQLFFGFSATAFTSESSKNMLLATATTDYAATLFSGTPVLSATPSDAAYYQCFNDFMKGYSYNGLNIPTMNNWTILDDYGKSPLGGEIFRAYYTDENKQEVQGVFASQYAEPIMFDLCAFYNVHFFTAPSYEYPQWQEVLNYCMSTAIYTSEFENAYYSKLNQTLETSKMIAQCADQISDMIMDSWNYRNTTYDIASQKYSDATLGYERVYDRETDRWYLAETGIESILEGDRYQVLTTDEAYTCEISGTLNWKD